MDKAAEKMMNEWAKKVKKPFALDSGIMLIPDPDDPFKFTTERDGKSWNIAEHLKEQFAKGNMRK